MHEIPLGFSGWIVAFEGYRRAALEGKFDPVAFKVEAGSRPASIKAVANDRISRPGQMSPDLMSEA